MGDKPSIVLTAVDETKAAFESVHRNIDGLSGAASNLNGIIGRLAPLLGAASFTEFSKKMLDSADQAGKLAQKAGLTTEAFTRLSASAKLSEVDNESLAKGMGHLSTSIATAASGIGTQAQAFKALGINVKDAHGNLKDTDAIVKEVSNKFAALQDGTGKTAAAMAIFGKSGQDMIPWLNSGGDDMERLAQLSDKLGLTLDGTTAQAAQDVNDRFATMGMAMEGMGNQVLKNMLPTFDTLSQAMVDGATNTDTMKNAADALSFILKGLISAAEGVIFAFKEVGNGMSGVAAAAVAAMHGDFSGAASIMRDMQSTFAEDSQKFSDQINKIWEDGSAKLQKTLVTSSAKAKLNFQLGGNTDGLSQKADAILAGMQADYNKGTEKKYRDLNDLGLNAVDKTYLDNLSEVSLRAARAREEVGKLNLTESQRSTILNKINTSETEQIQIMGKLREQVIANNSSWEHGAKTSMRNYLDAASNTAKQTETLFSNAFKGAEDAIVNFVKTGKLDFKSFADSIITDLIRIQVQKAIAGAVSAVFSADGNAFTGNGVQAFANGGAFGDGMVLNQPTPFLFANGGSFGMGVAGEAGPEGAMPLKRMSNGKLGVYAEGGGAGNIVINVMVDKQGQTSSNGAGKDMDTLGRRIGDKVKTVLIEEMRPGGILAQAGVHAA